MAMGGDQSGERGGENRRLNYYPHCDAEVPKTTYYRHRDKYLKKTGRKRSLAKGLLVRWVHLHLINHLICKPKILSIGLDKSKALALGRSEKAQNQQP